MSINHYENFPVASILLPAHLRPAVEDLYAFARRADDLADEGQVPTAVRQAALRAWSLAVQDLGAGRPLSSLLPAADRPLFERLRATIARHQLPVEPLLDLLSAFMQDLSVHRYPDEPSLLDYCRRSANPVGRLMLDLFRAASTDNIALSDAICTGLQRANFCQDIVLDFAMGRCYIPLDCMQRQGADPAELATLCRERPHALPDAWRAVLREQVLAARQALLAGSPLAWRLRGRIGLELRLVVHGGLRILEKLEAGGFNPFAIRPIIGRRDGLLLCWRAFCRPRPHPAPALVPSNES